jgi:hypothetical protein
MLLINKYDPPRHQPFLRATSVSFIRLLLPHPTTSYSKQKEGELAYTLFFYDHEDHYTG